MTNFFEKEIQEIVRALRTKEEAGVLARGIEMLEERLYRPGPQALDEVFARHFPERISRPLKQAFEERSLQGSPYAKDFFVELRSALSRLRILRLELAVDPTEEMIEKISSWVRREIGDLILLETDIDRTIFGGARVIFGGKYREYTLAKMIESLFESEREIILKEIRPPELKEKIRFNI